MKKLTTVNVRLDDETKEQLEALANAEKEPVSVIIRRALREYVERQKQSD